MNILRTPRIAIFVLVAVAFVVASAMVSMA